MWLRPRGSHAPHAGPRRPPFPQLRRDAQTPRYSLKLFSGSGRSGRRAVPWHRLHLSLPPAASLSPRLRPSSRPSRRLAGVGQASCGWGPSLSWAERSRGSELELGTVATCPPRLSPAGDWVRQSARTSSAAELPPAVPARLPTSKLPGLLPSDPRLGLADGSMRCTCAPHPINIGGCR